MNAKAQGVVLSSSVKAWILFIAQIYPVFLRKMATSTKN